VIIRYILWCDDERTVEPRTCLASNKVKEKHESWYMTHTVQR